MKMQSLFHPVWLSPKRNHVCFHRICSIPKLNTHWISLPPLCAPPIKRYPLKRYIHHHRHLSAGAVRGEGTVPSVILPVLFISAPDKRNSPEPKDQIAGNCKDELRPDIHGANPFPENQWGSALKNSPS